MIFDIKKIKLYLLILDIIFIIISVLSYMLDDYKDAFLFLLLSMGVYIIAEKVKKENE